MPGGFGKAGFALLVGAVLAGQRFLAALRKNFVQVRKRIAVLRAVTVVAKFFEGLQQHFGVAALGEGAAGFAETTGLALIKIFADGMAQQAEFGAEFLEAFARAVDGAVAAVGRMPGEEREDFVH